MNLLRVILATLVIFGTGALSGYFIAQKNLAYQTVAQPRQGGPKGGMPSWEERRKHMISRMEKDLTLNADQLEQVTAIFTESGERNKELWKQFRVPMDAEVERVNNQIRAILNPDQLAIFEEQLKRRKEGSKGGRPPGDASSPTQEPRSAEGDHCALTWPWIRQCPL